MPQLETYLTIGRLTSWLNRGLLAPLGTRGLTAQRRASAFPDIVSSMLDLMHALTLTGIDPGIAHVVTELDTVKLPLPAYPGPHASLIYLDNIHVEGLADRLSPDHKRMLPGSTFKLQRIVLYVDPDIPSDTRLMLIGNATPESAAQPVFRILQFMRDGEMTDGYYTQSMRADHFLSGALGNSADSTRWSMSRTSAPSGSTRVYFHIDMLSEYLGGYREQLVRVGNEQDQVHARTR